VRPAASAVRAARRKSLGEAVAASPGDGRAGAIILDVSTLELLLDDVERGIDCPVPITLPGRAPSPVAGACAQAGAAAKPRKAAVRRSEFRIFNVSLT
jgi:hypothetical protein